MSKIQKSIKRKYKNIYQSITFEDDYCNNKNIKYEVNPYQLLPSSLFRDYPSRRGLLIYHQIGSGKTLTSILWMKMWLYELKDRGYKKVIFISFLSLHKNFRSEIRKFFPKLYNRIIKRITFIDIDDIHKVSEYNFHMSLVIIDESHKYMNYILTDTPHARELWNVMWKERKIKILCLTATPINSSPFELSPLFNLLSGKNLFPRNGGKFNEKFINPIEYKVWNKSDMQELMDGYVSYFVGFKNDGNIIAQTSNLKLYKTKMTNIMKKLSTSQETELILTPEMVGLEGNMTKYWKEFNQYSPKIYTLIQHLKMNYKRPGITFIYTRYPDVIEYIAQYMINNNFLEFDHTLTNDPTYKNRFGKFTVLTENNLGNLRYINSARNMTGTDIKYVIGSVDVSIGISLHNVTTIHVMEAQPNYNDFEQVLGRTLRLCSHNLLPHHQRVVQPVLWVLDRGVFTSTRDQNIYKKSVQYDIMNDDYLSVAQGMAIDRLIWDIVPYKTMFRKLWEWYIEPYKPRTYTKKKIA